MSSKDRISAVGVVELRVLPNVHWGVIRVLIVVAKIGTLVSRSLSAAEARSVSRTGKRCDVTCDILRGSRIPRQYCDWRALKLN